MCIIGYIYSYFFGDFACPSNLLVVGCFLRNGVLFGFIEVAMVAALIYISIYPSEPSFGGLVDLAKQYLLFSFLLFLVVYVLMYFLLFVLLSYIASKPRGRS